MANGSLEAIYEDGYNTAMSGAECCPPNNLNPEEITIFNEGYHHANSGLIRRNY